LLPRLFKTTVYALTLCLEDISKTLLEVVDHGVQVVAFKLLLALLAEALHEVTEAGSLVALAVLEAALEEVAEGALDITMGNEVVSHGLHDGVFIQVPGVLGTVPACIAVTGAELHEGIIPRKEGGPGAGGSEPRVLKSPNWQTLPIYAISHLIISKPAAPNRRYLPISSAQRGE